MTPDFRRFLPLLLIAVFALLLIPSLTHRKHKGGLSDSTKSSQTIDAMQRVTAGEKTYQTTKGRFTSHVADLLSGSPGLAGDLAAGVDVSLDVSTNGKTYLARVSSDVLSLVRSGTAAATGPLSCVVLKSGSGVKCPGSGQ